MKPVLWGGPLWQALFGMAWTCDAKRMPLLRTLLTEQLPPLLPCASCRAHAVQHIPRVNRRAKGTPKSPGHAFRWLWYLKDEVNQTLRKPSLSLADLTERYVLHGGLVDEVAVADVLVLVALEAHELDRDDLCIELFHALAELLPLPIDSQFRASLASSSRPVVAASVRAAKAARIERGLHAFSVAHYRSVAS